MLESKKIVSNTKKYFTTAEEMGFMTDELMNILDKDFVGAPASTHLDLHNAFEGGLVDHLLRTTKFAISLNAALPDNLQSKKESIIKVCFLFQIGKAHLFVPNLSIWHKEKQGKMYEYNEELVSMGIGERSLYYALKAGVSLTEEESQAILNAAKDDSDKQAKFFTSPLGVLLKQANEWAIIEEKLLVPVKTPA